MSSEHLAVKDQILHPKGRFVCWECGNPIRRNVAKTEDGRTHHFGCLKRGMVAISFHCNSCGKDLRRGETSMTYVQGVPARSCSLCGVVGMVVSARAYANTWGVV